MIYSNSRYAEGKLFKAQDSRSKEYAISVTRDLPSVTQGFMYYSWRVSDRMDTVADNFLGSPDAWWQIMDFNPEILDPFDIPVGTVLRIPRA